MAGVRLVLLAIAHVLAPHRPEREVATAQRRWAGVARSAGRSGAAGGEVFALAHAVVARWWDEALRWEREEIWPHRLHRLAGVNAGSACMVADRGPGCGDLP